MVVIWRYLRWLGSGTLLCGFAVALWFAFRWLAESEGNSEEVFARIQVGMCQREVLAVLRTFDAGSGRYSSGVTTDGRAFHTFHYRHPSMDDLPPTEIKSCTLNALDSYGREIEVTLGLGGTVKGKRLSPTVWEERWDKLGRSLRDIPYRLRRSRTKYRYLVLGLTVTLLWMPAWAWRRWAARRSQPRKA